MYQCPVCEKSFANKKTCRRHERNIHHKLGTSACSVCDKSMRQDNLIKHMKTHEQPKDLVLCDRCGMCFHSTSLLDKHRREVHGNVFFLSFINININMVKLYNSERDNKPADSSIYKLCDQFL